MRRGVEKLDGRGDAELIELDLRQGDEFLKSAPGSQWPEVRIIRPVTAQTAQDNPELQALINVLGRKNIGKGNAFALGSIKCTYVAATEMGRMLSKKYDRIYDNRRKTIQLHTRLANHYEQFVKADKSANDSADLRNLIVSHELGDDLDLELSDIPNTAVDTSGNMWETAGFVVSGFKPVGHRKLALDLSGNEEIIDEMEATWEFLRSEGLDTNMVDKNRNPHLTVFESYAKIGATALTVIAAPREVDLVAPRMWPNTNQPGQGVSL